MNSSGHRWLNVLGYVCVAVGLAACGGTTSPTSGDGGSQDAGGTCIATVPDGGMCNNMIANVAPTITPTCATGTLPTGTGGTIVDGTYVSTAVTFYDGANCFRTPRSVTVVIAGGCYQEAADFSGLLSKFAASFNLTVQGNVLTLSLTCLPSGATISAPPSTFTATGSTLAIFTMDSTDGTNYVEVLTRQ